MSNAKLMKPLFYDGMFNADGRKMRAVFVREVSNGTDSYRLWQSDGKPYLDYPRAENDAYILYVEIGEYLASIQITEYALIDQCGYPAAAEELYGGKEKRTEYFRQLRESRSENDNAVSDAIAQEGERIRQLGSDPARQATHIKSILDQHVAIYAAAKNNGGQSFPDFVGALVLGELSTCRELSTKYKAKKQAEAIERQTKAEVENRAFCEEQNRIAERKLHEALHILKYGGILKNEPIEFYRSKSDLTSYSIVNYLMRKYEITVPLRTQGWINNRLVSITIEDGRCGNLRYMKSKGARCSQCIFDCINELIQKVCNSEEA